MTTHQIECFCALAKHHNFTKAAESMYLSQPAFSRVIASLEAELGCTLFVRDKGNPRLTEKGESILPHMKQMQEHYTKACSLAKLGTAQQQEETGGTIVFGVFRFGMLTFLPKMTAAYKKVNPKVHFDMAEHTGVSIFPALKSMDVDLTHTNYIPTGYSKYLSTLEIGRYTHKAILPAGHPLVQKKDLRLEDLAHERFVSVDRQQFPLMNSRLYTACANAGFVPNIVREFDTLTNIFDYIAEGRAITIMAAGEGVRPGVVAILLLEIDPDPTRLVWATANEKPELLDFIEFVRNQMKENSKSGLQIDSKK